MLTEYNLTQRKQLIEKILEAKNVPPISHSIVFLTYINKIICVGALIDYNMVLIPTSCDIKKNTVKDITAWAGNAPPIFLHDLVDCDNSDGTIAITIVSNHSQNLEL